MRETRYRRGRNRDAAGAPKAGKRRGISLRLAVSLIAFALCATVSISVADAATGGASAFTPSPGEASSASEGGLAFSPFRVAGASWYGGPSMWGRETACGETLRKNTLGVAHRSLPCGTTVKFVYHGHSLVTQVIDRGPYVHGRSWDLTQAASEALALEGIGQVRYAVAIENARQR
jgi:rare lipoprotein A (peptidoglycan hydrolase)